jgi:quercetin dioxygenase-like cupin family protein
MKRALLLTVLLASAVALPTGRALAQAAGPDVVYQAALPATVASGDYTLLSLVIDFPPGSGFPEHTHPGPVVVTVLEGGITLREKGSERKVGTGESWTENAGDRHYVLNEGSTNCRIFATLLVPKGADPQTFLPGGQGADLPAPNITYQVAQSATVAGGDYSVLNLVLDFKPQAGVPTHVHPGPVTVMVLSGQITQHDDTGDKVFLTGGTWAETANHMHSVINEGQTTTRMAAGLLVPKGAEPQTIVSAPPVGMPRTGAGGEPVVPLWWPIPVSALVLGLLLRVWSLRRERRSTPPTRHEPSDN